MAIKKITTSNFSLTSSWEVYRRLGAYNGADIGDGTYGTREMVLAFLKAPSEGTATKTFSYSLPSGSRIKSASIWATLGSPKTGIGIVKANGVHMNQKSGAERGANVTLNGLSGTLSVTFEFRANGSKEAVGKGSATLSFSNVYLWIVYEEGSNSSGSGSSGSSSSSSSSSYTDFTSNMQASGQYPSPPQAVCIIDQTNWHVYEFDGVTKVQHGISVDIQEEPSKKKELYTNNARNEPDTLSLDIIMSDVYATKGDLYYDSGSFTSDQKTAFEWSRQFLLPPHMNSDTWTRSQNAYYTLYNLKYNRRKLSIITPHYVYTDMIIKSITATWDETCTYGLIAQIEFQGAYETVAKTDNTSSTASSDEGTRTPSSIYGTLSGWKNP